MVIVAGYIVVDPEHREDYLDGCVSRWFEQAAAIVAASVAEYDVSDESTLI